MDFYHTQIVEGDIAVKLERWLPHIGHIQIAGAPGRHEPDIGEINYAWLLRRVDELGYDGWVGCEYRPLHDHGVGPRVARTHASARRRRVIRPRCAPSVDAKDRGRRR